MRYCREKRAREAAAILHDASASEHTQSAAKSVRPTLLSDSNGSWPLDTELIARQVKRHQDPIKQSDILEELERQVSLPNDAAEEEDDNERRSLVNSISRMVQAKGATGRVRWGRLLQAACEVKLSQVSGPAEEVPSWNALEHAFDDPQNHHISSCEEAHPGLCLSRHADIYTECLQFGKWLKKITASFPESQRYQTMFRFHNHHSVLFVYQMGGQGGPDGWQVYCPVRLAGVPIDGGANSLRYKVSSCKYPMTASLLSNPSDAKLPWTLTAEALGVLLCRQFLLVSPSPLVWSQMSVYCDGGGCMKLLASLRHDYATLSDEAKKKTEIDPADAILRHFGISAKHAEQRRQLLMQKVGYDTVGSDESNPDESGGEALMFERPETTKLLGEDLGEEPHSDEAEMAEDTSSDDERAPAAPPSAPSYRLRGKLPCPATTPPLPPLPPPDCLPPDELLSPPPLVCPAPASALSLSPPVGPAPPPVAPAPAPAGPAPPPVGPAPAVAPPPSLVGRTAAAVVIDGDTFFELRKNVGGGSKMLVGYSIQCTHPGHQSPDCVKDCTFGSTDPMLPEECRARLLRWRDAAHLVDGRLSHKLYGGRLLARLATS